jgi:hypothetical protein
LPFWNACLRARFLVGFVSFWPLCWLFFFDLWILITPLVSSNSSYIHIQCIQSAKSVPKSLHAWFYNDGLVFHCNIYSTNKH